MTQPDPVSHPISAPKPPVPVTEKILKGILKVPNAQQYELDDLDNVSRAAEPSLTPALERDDAQTHPLRTMFQKLRLNRGSPSKSSKEDAQLHPLRSIVKKLKCQPNPPSYSGSSPFLALPAELRNRIYAFALINSPALATFVWLERGKLKGRVVRTPSHYRGIKSRGTGGFSDLDTNGRGLAASLLRVSKQVRTEAAAYFWSNHFQVEDVIVFGRLLRAAGPHAFQFIFEAQIVGRRPYDGTFDRMSFEMRRHRRFLLPLWLLGESEQPWIYLRILYKALYYQGNRNGTVDNVRSTRGTVRAMWRFVVMPNGRLWRDRSGSDSDIDDLALYLAVTVITWAKEHEVQLLSFWRGGPNYRRLCGCVKNESEVLREASFFLGLTLATSRKEERPQLLKQLEEMRRLRNAQLLKQ